MPGYKEVPDHWKAPMGPYYQAPEEYGGEWWLITPFTTSKPWLYQDGVPDKPPEVLPPGFEHLFGKRPKLEDFRGEPRSHRRWQVAVVQWEQELRYFKGVGLPEWATEPALNEANGVYVAWRLSTPTFYESRYGWMGRFRESTIDDYDSSAHQVILYPHHVVAQFQIRDWLANDRAPHKWHPFVPPTIFQRDARLFRDG